MMLAMFIHCRGYNVVSRLQLHRLYFDFLQQHYSWIQYHYCENWMTYTHSGLTFTFEVHTQYLPYCLYLDMGDGFSVILTGAC